RRALPLIRDAGDELVALVEASERLEDHHLQLPEIATVGERDHAEGGWRHHAQDLLIVRRGRAVRARLARLREGADTRARRIRGRATARCGGATDGSTAGGAGRGRRGIRRATASATTGGQERAHGARGGHTEHRAAVYGRVLVLRRLMG